VTHPWLGRSFVNLFRMPDGSLAPSVRYATRAEAEQHQNATSFVACVEIAEVAVGISYGSARRATDR
jgi:hypothetical protein